MSMLLTVPHSSMPAFFYINPYIYVSQNKNPLVFILLQRTSSSITVKQMSMSQITMQAVCHANLYLLCGVYCIDYCL